MAVKHPIHQLDTTAQNPPVMGQGPRTSPCAVNSHWHHEAPTPGALTPEETEGTHQDERYSVAAGLPAIYQTIRFAVKEAGVVRGVSALLKVNQKNGFDCQSCAWPKNKIHVRAPSDTSVCGL